MLQTPNSRISRRRKVTISNSPSINRWCWCVAEQRWFVLILQQLLKCSPLIILHELWGASMTLEAGECHCVTKRSDCVSRWFVLWKCRCCKCFVETGDTQSGFLDGVWLNLNLKGRFSEVLSVYSCLCHACSSLDPVDQITYLNLVFSPRPSLPLSQTHQVWRIYFIFSNNEAEIQFISVYPSFFFVSLHNVTE